VVLQEKFGRTIETATKYKEMKAIVEWVYPKGVKDGDLYEFRLNDTVKLPLLTMTDSSNETTYFQGGKVSGTPALIRITDPLSKTTKVVEGVIVKEAEGIYAIPKRFVEKDVVPLIGKVENEIEKEAEKVEDTAKEVIEEIKHSKTIMGFTKKQLLAMTVGAIVLIKIFK